MPHVIIVGGGLSGLAIAYGLKQLAPHATTTLLEHREATGGKIGTVNQDGFRVETGPNGFLDRTPHLPRLCQDLGLADRLVTASEAARKNRYLFLRERLQKLPGGLLPFLTSPLLSLSGKFKLLTEPFRGRPAHVPADESIAAFVTRRAGKEAADVLADALVTGIHGGDPAQLSVAAAFPRLPEMEKEAGSLFRGFIRAAKQRRKEAQERGEPPPGPQRMWSFREGLQLLVDRLTEASGATIRTGVRVRSLRRAAGAAGWEVRGEGAEAWSADAVVLTCPAPEQASVLADLDAPLAEDVAGIPYNRIAVVAMGYRRSDCGVNPDGFGYIAPQNTRRDVLGVQWCSSIYPDRAPAGCVLFRALCGGVHRGDMLDRDDESLVRAVHQEMKLAMKVTAEPVFHRVVRWSAAIPQYVIGHRERVARVQAAAARHPGLVLAGNPYYGVSMGDCVEQGELVAARLAASFAQGASGA